MSKKLTIGIFSALHKPNLGGIEVFTENLSRELAGMGHDVTIVTSNTFGLATEEIDEYGIRIIRMPAYPLLNGRLPWPKRNREFDSLASKLKSVGFDGILINTRFFPHSLVALDIAEANGVKPVMLDHGSAYITLGNPIADIAIRRWEHMITNRIKRHPVDFYGISNASLEWLKNFDIDGLGTISNAIDADAFASGASDRDFRGELLFEPNEFVVAFTGRLIPEKGILNLLKAFELLSGMGVNARLLVAGDGPLMSNVKEASGNVLALGKLSRPDVAALLKQTDVFCLPTRSEGFATSLLEAAACECAPIVTNVGGVSELIPDESCGVILPNAEPETIANAILKLRDDSEACSMIAECAHEQSKRFTWSNTAKSVLTAFDRARNGEVGNLEQN